MAHSNGTIKQANSKSRIRDGGLPAPRSILPGPFRSWRRVFLLWLLALAKSSAPGTLPNPGFGLEPDFFRSLDHYLKVVAMIGTRRLKSSKLQDSQMTAFRSFLVRFSLSATEESL